jgi:hypothetical protein
MRVTAASDLELLQGAKGIPDFDTLAINDPNADCNSAEVLTHALDDSSASNRAFAVLMLERVNSGKMCAGVNDAQ